MPAGHAIAHRMHGFTRQKDPGASGTIKVYKDPCVVELVSLAAESRTLANPSQPGVSLEIAFKTDGGDVTLTVTNGYNEVGSTTLVFADVGQIAVFRSYREGSNFRWRLTYSNIPGASTEGPSVITVPDAATYTVLAVNSGKTHILPDLTASCTLTLPTAVAGLEYVFIGKGVAADGQDWIFSTGGANFYLGGLGFLDTDDPADTVVAVYPNGSSNDFMNIIAPGAGTRVHLICDGTNWIVNGQVIGATAPTFADT